MPQAVAAVYYGFQAYSAYAASAYWAAAAYAAVATAIVYGDVQRRSSAKKLARGQRDDFNASLQDRTVSIISSDNPWPIVFGEGVRVGPSYTAILTSGERDEYKHLVAVWGAHKSGAITDVQLLGQSVGPLDSEGLVQVGSRWMNTTTDVQSQVVTISPTGTLTMAQTISNVIAIYFPAVGGGASEREQIAGSTVTFTGNVITLPSSLVATWAGREVRVAYEDLQRTARLRVRHHLGSADQTADASLLAEVPGDWSASDRGRGLTYSVFRFDLNEPEFQAGPPNPTATLNGLECYDPRLDSTFPGGSGPQRLADPSTWTVTSNAALCTARFLISEFGKNARPSQVMWDSVAAAANVCDENPSIGGVSGRRYTCHGRFTTADDPDNTLDKLCQCMAGFATFVGGAWYLQAGAFTAPVMALTDDDNAGPVELVPSPPSSEIMNGMRGRFYDPTRFSQSTDYPPYRNAALATADGAEYWGDLDLPFTNAAWRSHQLARIQVERSRAMQLVYPAKQRAMRLKPGQRITLTCAALNLLNAVFRVVRREKQPSGVVRLTLAFDDPSFYDDVDAPTVVLPPTVATSNAFVVQPVVGLLAQSDESTVLRDADGTVLSRVRLSYTASADVLVQSAGWLDIETQEEGSTLWARATPAPGNSVAAYLQGLRDERVHLVRARWRNTFAQSDWRSTSVLTSAPSTLEGGVPGPAGASVFTGEIYIQSTSTPSAPSGGSFDFSTSTLTPPAGHTVARPGFNPAAATWRFNFTFNATTVGATVAAGTWSGPVKVDGGAASSPVPFGVGATSLEVNSGVAANAYIRFNTDGTISQREGNGGSYVAAGNWYVPTTAGIGSSFRLRTLLASGDALAFGAVGDYVSLSSERVFRLEQPVSGSYAAKQTILQHYIAASGSSVALAEGSSVLAAQYDPAA
jgi:hypothetical protein